MQIGGAVLLLFKAVCQKGSEVCLVTGMPQDATKMLGKREFFYFHAGLKWASDQVHDAQSPC